MTRLLAFFLLSLPPALAVGQTDADRAGKADGDAPITAGDTGATPAAQALQETLYDVIALRYQVQQAHWNVVGEDFYQLHDVTGDFYEALDGLVDLVGEQRLSLGYPSTAVAGAVAEHADLAAMPNGYISAEQLVSVLNSSYSRLSANLQTRITAVGESADLVSQDVLIGVAKMIDKQRWILSSHAAEVTAD